MARIVLFKHLAKRVHWGKNKVESGEKRGEKSGPKEIKEERKRV